MAFKNFSPKTKILPHSFYNRKPTVVARALLGTYIVRKIGRNVLVGKIVETEAYLSTADPAAHGFNGKTNRNKSLYKRAGHAYVHRMRQWHLLDVVTEKEHVPSSVLIRAVEPIEGMKIMKKFRSIDDIQNLTNGPGKFCHAFHITMELDGVDVTREKSALFLAAPKSALPSKSIGVSSRIGISKGTEMQLRFWIKGNAFVSR